MTSGRWRALAALASALLATSAGTARADDPAPAPAPDPSPPGPPTRARRAIAAAAAIIPGAIVHGTGHWLVGERRTAKRLLVLEGVGLGLAAVGGLPIAVSGGAEETLPGLVLLVPAAGLLLSTIAADAWGAAGGACIAGTPAAPPALELAAGYTFVGDPRVPFANLATGDVAARSGPALVRAGGWFGDGTWQARGHAALRLRGPRAGETRADITSIDLGVAAAEERRRDQGLRVFTTELVATARIDLAHIGPSLRGTFATTSLGLGVERIRYTATGAVDRSSLMSGRIGWGFVLGDGRRRALEAELYYEHRRDTLAGGLTPPLPFNGFIGYVGAGTTAWLGRYGASARVEIGSAYIVSLAAQVRIPELP